jgi:hypothetical protein
MEHLGFGLWVDQGEDSHSCTRRLGFSLYREYSACRGEATQPGEPGESWDTGLLAPDHLSGCREGLGRASQHEASSEKTSGPLGVTRVRQLTLSLGC